MYSILKTQFGPYDQYQIKNENDAESISIIPAFGGLLNDWKVQTKMGLSGLFQNYNNHHDLEEKIDINFQGPKLIPYPNRIDDGQYTFEKSVYQFEHGKIGEPNSIHGFFCRLPMQVIDRSCYSDHASITLHHSYNGSIKGYPFAFDIDLIYQLHASDGLTIHTRIKNIGDSNMPFGDGWHPYFVSAQGISDFELEFHAIGKLETSGYNIPTGKINPYDRFDKLQPIGNTQLDDCFELRDDRILLKYPNESFTLEFWQEMGKGKYNYLQVYTPEERMSIAIEPMSCAPNAFNSGMGLIEIAPMEEIDLRHGVRIIRETE